MYRGNLSLHTFFNIFFFIRKFSNLRICSNLVGFNRINSIVILLNVQNQLSGEHFDSFIAPSVTSYDNAENGDIEVVLPSDYTRSMHYHSEEQF